MADHAAGPRTGRVAQRRRSGTPLVQAAGAFAEQAHAGQVRDHGVPYWQHPAAVAKTLELLCHQTDPEVLAAALLHDVVEDTCVTLDAIRARFGPRVAELVDVLTRQDGETPERYWARIVGHSDEAVQIKMADRLCNLRDSLYARPEKRARFVRQTERLYGPLLERVSPDLRAALGDALQRAKDW